MWIAGVRRRAVLERERAMATFLRKCNAHHALTLRQLSSQPSAAKKASSAVWVMGGIVCVAGYAAGVYATMNAFSKPMPDGSSVTEEARKSAYEKGASTYEKDVCSGEAWLGIEKLRKELLQHADGMVLEVASGTGHNFNLYPSGCTITAVDNCAAMVKICQSKNSASVESIHVMDTANMTFSDQSFDTVVDTFGICSYEDPVTSLREMQRVCKKEGKILLLEHGRSWLAPLNWMLDGSAANHAKKWGCWWNRDIQEIVRQSGLQIVERKSYHLGTTHMVIAKRANR
mmetsp:Transcript_3576/g.8773  ORF Transcript_3576/g.8773 Transcript_3576/m.8773 type:complete len:287 (+) Transcript_3576:89-949(+)